MIEPKREPRLIALEKSIGGAFFAVLILSIILQVATRLLPRYFGTSAVISLPWTEELSRFAFVWLLMLGASVGIYNQEHFALTLVRDAVPKAVQWWMEFLVYAFELIFIGFLIKYGYLMAEMVWGQVSPALGLRYAYVYLSVPVGACLMGIHAIGNMVKRYATSQPTTGGV
jgi:TRAP-type C4-dicarboxylate transport system permease small subunit